MGNVERRDILRVAEVRNWAPDPRPGPGAVPLLLARRAMERAAVPAPVSR
jgi:hypothetical protein